MNSAHNSGVTPDVHIEPATIEDLSSLTELVVDLLELQDDFVPDPALQERGIRHILEEPARGRIFVVRAQDRIVGMANLLFTVSTAMGGFVLIMEDVIIHPEHRGQGFGAMLLEAVIAFAKEKDFKRITLLADRLSNDSQAFFQQHGFQFSSLIPMRLILTTESLSES
ncbi:GNAT family N-acetyltransferase [Roseibacillus persicicus]|uniref:GNAT family N-acetyltransferase n=1 Tax=Roseibacillus persicicus TaxID=454148 RepID=UPI001E2CD3A7|nr:GNAT family N-acetyltransferase [Roseibacillus persicicus]MDQ8191076.1 GNAT family N-acetyltransferase [Roseibacillus persicicus]